jgi:hypothetical protein
MRFLEFLLSETEEVNIDPENMSSDELQARATKLKKMAAMKSRGKDKLVDDQALRALRQEYNVAKYPQQKAEIMRRIKALKTKDTGQSSSPNVAV